jgi:hypothetical protein
MSDDRNDGKPQRSRRCKAVRPCLAAAPVTTTELTGSATGRATRGGVRYNSRNRWLPCQRCDRPNEASSSRIQIPRHDRQVLLRLQGRLVQGPDAARGCAQCCCHPARRCWLRLGQHIWWPGPDTRTIRETRHQNKILKSLNIRAPDTLEGIDHLDPTDRFQLN